MKLQNPQLANIQTIIFDFGNVLLDIDISLTIDAFARLGIDQLNPQDIHPNNIGIFHAMEVGQASQQNFVDAIRKLASKPQNITDQQIIDAWNLLLLPFDYTRFELLDRLRENYKIILLSNTNKVHHDYWVPKFDRENPFARSFNSYFDHIFYSDELQLRKPEREIYETVQQIAQISPLTTLFIDDTAPNLVEPQKMGWNVHHLLKPQTVFDLFI